MKKYSIGLLSTFLFVGNLFSQNVVKMSAVKSNDYGVAYNLPKTVLNIKAEATKTTRKAGEYYEYAERYLNITNPVTKDETIYSLTSISATTDGIPDKENSYLVEFKSNTTAPYVTLTKDGLICAINSDAVIEPKEDNSIATTKQIQTSSTSNPNIYLSEETLKAGSKSKQAELIAKQILKLRETRTNILTGEADNMPPDGNAYKVVMEQIDLQEKALLSLFVGTETSEVLNKEYSIAVPKDKNIENYIVFRFSKKLGFLDNNDLAGAPVQLSLINEEPFREPPILTPKEQKDLEKKFSQGIIYNIPGKAQLTIRYDNKTLVNKTCDIVQYGVQDVLVPKMFDNNKEPIKVIFFPDLGAIKQIIQ